MKRFLDHEDSLTPPQARLDYNTDAKAVSPTESKVDCFKPSSGIGIRL